jgi:hypothetical protein
LVHEFLAVIVPFDICVVDLFIVEMLWPINLAWWILLNRKQIMLDILNFVGIRQDNIIGAFPSFEKELIEFGYGNIMIKDPQILNKLP